MVQASKCFFLAVNLSKDFANFRHLANALIMWHILLKSGINEENAFILTPENFYKDELFVLSKEYIYISVKENTIVPFRHEKLHPDLQFGIKRILNALMGNCPCLRGLDRNSKIIVYITGHGGEGFLKVCDRDYLFRDDLENALHVLSRRVSKVIVIIDSCQANSLVGDVPANMAFISTSRVGEPSLSYENSSELGVALVDGFPYFFYKQIRAIFDTPMSMLPELFPYELMGSNVSVRGNLEFKFADLLT